MRVVHQRRPRQRDGSERKVERPLLAQEPSTPCCTVREPKPPGKSVTDDDANLPAAVQGAC